MDIEALSPPVNPTQLPLAPEVQGDVEQVLGDEEEVSWRIILTPLDYH